MCNVVYLHSRTKTNTMTYINIKTSEGVETIDQFDTRKEARTMLKEYKIASNYYTDAYLSQRCTKDWSN